MTSITIREVGGVEWQDSLRALHAECFPSDVHEDYLKGRWWVAFDHAKTPIAFVGARPADDLEEYTYLSRVGVLPCARGRGLQRRLMRTAERAFKATSTHMVSTTYCNHPSANNFIRLGYLMYEPSTHWGAEGTCYWIKPLRT